MQLCLHAFYCANRIMMPFYDFYQHEYFKLRQVVSWYKSPFLHFHKFYLKKRKWNLSACLYISIIICNLENVLIFNFWKLDVFSQIMLLPDCTPIAICPCDCLWLCLSQCTPSCPPPRSLSHPLAWETNFTPMSLLLFWALRACRVGCVHEHVWRGATGWEVPPLSPCV